MHPSEAMRATINRSTPIDLVPGPNPVRSPSRNPAPKSYQVHRGWDQGVFVVFTSLRIKLFFLRNDICIASVRADSSSEIDTNSLATGGETE